MSLLIFVFVMEYLNRALMVTAAQQQFRHHPGCHGLKLNMLSFVDDLLLFSQADIQSVKCLMTAFKHFFDCFGLEANIEKSQLVVVGVTEETEDKLVALIGFQLGVLPFYLGVAVKAQGMNK